jgi:hypothetical protein
MIYDKVQKKVYYTRNSIPELPLPRLTFPLFLRGLPNDAFRITYTKCPRRKGQHSGRSKCPRRKGQHSGSSQYQ